MTKSFYKQIVDSFHFNEKKDFEAVCSILDKKVYEKHNVVVISEDPYLLLLIFLCLIRHDDIKIHIVNPKEGEDEIKRLVNIINPDVIVDVNNKWIEQLSHEPRYDVDYKDRELNFSITTYTPYPTKVYKTESDLFVLLVNSLIKDLDRFDLVDNHDYGCIPFASNNPDYLLYLIALRVISPNMSIGNEQDVWVHEHNKAKTLFIPKKEFNELYESKVLSLFERPFIFRLYLKHIWFVNLLIKRRLKHAFKYFKNVVVIGVLDNIYMMELLSNLSFVKFYGIFPMTSALQFGTITKSLNILIPEGNELKSDRFVPYNQNHFNLTYSLFDENEDDRRVYSLPNRSLVYVKHTYHENNQNKHKYEVIGTHENVFINKGSYIYPETLERVINSNPLIRRSVILTFNKRIVLVIEPNMDILDSIRINQGMFHSIIQQQIDALNTKLPVEYQIDSFLVGTSFIELDRMGSINRAPFNSINKQM